MHLKGDFMDHPNGIMLRYDMGVLCNMSVLCDMKSTLHNRVHHVI